RHNVDAFRFKFSNVTVPVVRRRVVSMLRNASEGLAAEVAEGLGMELTDPMPRALAEPRQAEVDVSPALSLMARPGEAGIQARKVAVLVADGVDGEMVWEVTRSLQEQGAVVRLVGPRIGPVAPETGQAIDADASLENHPGVLFDVMVVPGGKMAGQLLAADPKAREFLVDQFFHSKSIWVSRDAEERLRKAGITAEDEALPGIFVTQDSDAKAIQTFVSALGHHRHFERERPAAAA